MFVDCVCMCACAFIVDRQWRSQRGDMGACPRGTWVHAPLGDMGACPPVVAGNNHLSPASGGFAPRPHRSSAPGPHWGTSVLQTSSFFLATSLLIDVW